MSETYMPNLSTLLNLETLEQVFGGEWVVMVLESYFNVQLRPNPSWTIKYCRQRYLKLASHSGLDSQQLSLVQLRTSMFFPSVSSFQSDSWLETFSPQGSFSPTKHNSGDILYLIYHHILPSKNWTVNKKRLGLHFSAKLHFKYVTKIW